MVIGKIKDVKIIAKGYGKILQMVTVLRKLSLCAAGA
jgi:hypothetical protein